MNLFDRKQIKNIKSRDVFKLCKDQQDIFKSWV